MRKKPVDAIRFNHNADMTEVETFKVNQKNMWVVDKINVSSDRVLWTKLTPQEQRQFILTYLILSKIDTSQGIIGMPILAEKTPSIYASGIYTLQGGMEVIHAGSYNKQLATFISKAEEAKYLDFVDNSEEVSRVVDFLIQSMIDIDNEPISEMAKHLINLAQSTALESFLFYLLFYYPLYLANERNLMVRSAEVVRLIMRDESVHGAFSGYQFRKYIVQESKETQAYIMKYIEDFMSELFTRIRPLLDMIYEEVEIREDIERFANYNFNRTLRNLGIEEVFKGEEIEFNATIASEVTKALEVTHDIFSMTMNVYFMMDAESYTNKHIDRVNQRLEKRSKLAPPLKRKLNRIQEI